MPRAWPPLTVAEIADCLRALDCTMDRQQSSHQVWVHRQSGRIGVLDTKWNAVSGPTLKHLVSEQLGFSREVFYRATTRSARKIR